MWQVHRCDGLLTRAHVRPVGRVRQAPVATALCRRAVAAGLTCMANDFTVDLALLKRLHDDYMRREAECNAGGIPILTDEGVIAAREAWLKELAKLPGWEHMGKPEGSA